MKSIYKISVPAIAACSLLAFAVAFAQESQSQPSACQQVACGGQCPVEKPDKPKDDALVSPYSQEVACGGQCPVAKPDKPKETALSGVSQDLIACSGKGKGKAPEEKPA